MTDGTVEYQSFLDDNCTGKMTNTPTEYVWLRDFKNRDFLHKYHHLSSSRELVQMIHRIRSAENKEKNAFRVIKIQLMPEIMHFHIISEFIRMETLTQTKIITTVRSLSRKEKFELMNDVLLLKMDALAHELAHHMIQEEKKVALVLGDYGESVMPLTTPNTNNPTITSTPTSTATPREITFIDRKGLKYVQSASDVQESTLLSEYFEDPNMTEVVLPSIYDFGNVRSFFIFRQNMPFAVYRTLVYEILKELSESALYELAQDLAVVGLPCGGTIVNSHIVESLCQDTRNSMKLATMISNRQIRAVQNNNITENNSSHLSLTDLRDLSNQGMNSIRQALMNSKLPVSLLTVQVMQTMKLPAGLAADLLAKFPEFTHTRQPLG